LYNKTEEVKYIYGIAVNPAHKEVFWGVSQGGNSTGGVLKAPHKGEKKNITVINRNASVSAMAYDDTYTIYVSNNTVYAMDLDRVKQYTASSGFFTGADAVTILDDYIYVADAQKGIYYIKQNDTAEYDTPRQLLSTKGVNAIYFATLSNAYFLKYGIIAISTFVMFYLF
jgi:hypothetical protein